MARNTNVENELENEIENDPAELDREAWLAECAAIKCRIDDSDVWAYSGGRLFRVAPIPGFASLPANSRRLVASMAMQFLPTRVGQTGTGDLSMEVANAIAAPDEYFNIRDKDAFEAAFENRIAELVDAKMGWDVEKLGKEAKDERGEVIRASAAKAENRERYFDSAVDAAKEAGANVVKERKRRRKAVGPDKGVEL